MALRLFLDHNLSPETTAFLRNDVGLDATDSREQKLQAASDSAIAAYAAREGRIILTFDTDFGDVRDFPPESYPGIIRLKVHPQNVEILHPVLRDFFSKVREEDLRGALVTLEPGFYRIRRIAPKE